MAATQVTHSWRAVLRTAFQVVISLAALLASNAASIPHAAGLGVAVAAGAAVTKVMANPGVEAFLQQYLPFLSAEPASK